MSERPPEQGSPEHEALCQRCGVSCHIAAVLEDGRRVVVEGLHCKFYGTLDDGEPGCTVYEERFEKAPWCMRMLRARIMGALRTDCPYVWKDYPALQGKVRVSAEEYDSLWPQIAASLLAIGPVGTHLSWKKFLKLANKRDPDHVWKIRFNAVETSGELSRTKRGWTKVQEALRGT